ncbi:uncharacterized protein FIBRA_01569 [Fibroporia radiculosa]|uniref:Chitin deacetylase n=1 Tax=Fibroporia radiculosa TaxID=599839 RepID=J4I8K1_9APHY|nr:uncharacterized protein FIBRA_01569 [Fibroporia radiculosa]CCL99551.1 predicted protein [Fibroporia radiculosa]
MPRRVLIGFGVDVDAVAGWLGSYGGEDSPLDISRGLYSGEVGVPRLLKLFKKYDIKTTWFIPEQQKDILDHTYNLLTAFNNGIPPKGSVAPWWETSSEGTQLLLDKGIEYDHSNMAHDSQAYYLRDQDTWTKIDYNAAAHTWMKPLQRGNITGLVELPANWYLDDLPPMMFIKSSPNSHGWVNSRDVEQLWKDMFTYLYREEEDFVFPITIHPDVSGRPHVLLMLERFIEWVNTHENVHWVRMEHMAREFRDKNPPPAGARMPRGMETTGAPGN